MRKRQSGHKSSIKSSCHKYLDSINEEILTFFDARMIFGTLHQGMPPTGYKDQLRKLGLYRFYREELQMLDWPEHRINAFLNELEKIH